MIGGKQIIYVLKGDTVEQRAVTVGLSDNDRVEILSGVVQGDKVVIAGQGNLTDGAKVEVVSQS
jgi:multidrug efflux system membrane fusion protein